MGVEVDIVKAKHLGWKRKVVLKVKGVEVEIHYSRVQASVPPFSDGMVWFVNHLIQTVF